MNSKERYEYEQMMNALNSQAMQQSMQSIAAQQGLGNFGSYMTQTRALTQQERIDAAKKNMEQAIAEYERLTLDTPVQGPTMRFMNKYPAVKNAWEELCILWKTVGKE